MGANVGTTRLVIPFKLRIITSQLHLDVTVPVPGEVLSNGWDIEVISTRGGLPAAPIKKRMLRAEATGSYRMLILSL